MSGSSKRSWVVWFLPFLVSGLMAFGALIGMSIISDATRQGGPAGDVAGAAGALLVLLCSVSGFVMAALTLIAAKLLRRDPPGRAAFRLGLSLVGGGIIAVVESYPGQGATVAAWFLIIGLPVLLVWPWHAKAALRAENRTG